jgi:hypothetical protein
VIAADTSAFQEPNTNGYAISKTPRTRKRKRDKKLLMYLLAYFSIFKWLLSVPALSVFFRKGNYEALRRAHEKKIGK